MQQMQGWERGRSRTGSWVPCPCWSSSWGLIEKTQAQPWLSGMFQDSGSFLKFAMPGFQGACSWNIYPFKKAFMKDTTFGGILFDVASRGQPLTYFFQDFSASKQFLWMAYFWSPQGRGHNPAKKLDPKFINTPHSTTVLAHQGMADTILMILDTTQIWNQVMKLGLKTASSRSGGQPILSCSTISFTI